MATSADHQPKVKAFQRCDILITTPLRLVHIIRQELVDLSRVHLLVLDEADRLLELGFLDQIDEIFAALKGSTRLQRALFSATVPVAVEELASTFLNDPIEVVVGDRIAPTSSVTQKLLFVGQEEGKILAVRQMLKQGVKPPVLIFVDSIERAKSLFTEMVYDGINVDVIHSDKTQVQRENVIKNFRLGKIWVLIATDLLARGIDFKGVNSVINYDFPHSTISYIHRIGRTGRAGRSGQAITFFTREDAAHLRTIASVMKRSGCDVPEWMLSLDPKRLPKRQDSQRKRKEVVQEKKQLLRNKKVRSLNTELPGPYRGQARDDSSDDREDEDGE